MSNGEEELYDGDKIINSILEHDSAWGLTYLFTYAIFRIIPDAWRLIFLGIYRNKSIGKIVSAPFIDGIFILVISGSLEHSGLPDIGVNLMGGITGFVGVAKIRDLIEGKLTQRPGGGNHENQ